MNDWFEDVEKEFNDLSTSAVDDRSLTPFDDYWSSPRRPFHDPLWDMRMSSGDFGRDWMTPYLSRRTDLVPSRSQRSERMVEMEKKFQELVKNVDTRFTGMFGVLDEPSFGRQQVQVEHEGISGSTSKPQNFSMKVDVQDFKPEEVKVKVQGGQVLVHAKRENKNEGEGMYAYSYREFRRAFTLPQGVDAERLTSSLSSAGVLQIDAPVAAAIEAPKSTPISVTVDG